MAQWIAKLLRWCADRIDWDGAPKATHLSFTFEPNKGMVINDRNIGCRLWHMGSADYQKAHNESGIQ